jgi:hypothetical protein
MMKVGMIDVTALKHEVKLHLHEKSMTDAADGLIDVTAWNHLVKLD